MRFMMIVQASKESEEGAMPTEEQLAEMAAFNEELAAAGALLAGEGLHPSSRGARVRYNGDTRSVTDGPFVETKELIGGFWIIRVDSKDAAIEWARRIPFRDGVVEIRQVFEMDDFGAEFTPELRAQDARIRDRMAVQEQR